MLTRKNTVLIYKSTTNITNFLNRCDVTDREKVFELHQRIKKDVEGYVTILVNNAGIMPTHPLLQQTELEIRKTFDVNVYAHFWVSFFLCIVFIWTP